MCTGSDVVLYSINCHSSAYKPRFCARTIHRTTYIYNEAVLKTIRTRNYTVISLGTARSQGQPRRPKPSKGNEPMDKRAIHTSREIIMSDSMYSNRQPALSEEKSIKYQGSASVKLKVLCFQLEQDPRNVQQLRKLFEKSGYNQVDVRNHVLVVVDSQSLATAVQN
jgi:hypothetical protein